MPVPVPESNSVEEWTEQIYVQCPFSPALLALSASATFSPIEDIIAVISDKGTIHIFSLTALHPSIGILERNKQSSLANAILVPLLPKYFQSRWRFGKARVPLESRYEFFKLGWWGRVVVIGRDGEWWWEYRGTTTGSVRRLGINGILMLDETGRFVEMFDGLVIGVNSFFGPGNHYWRFGVTVRKRNLIPHSQDHHRIRNLVRQAAFIGNAYV